MPTTVWGWLCGIGPWALSWLYCAGRVPHGAFQLLLFASVPDGTWEQQTSQPRVLCVLVAFNVCTGIQSQRSLIPWAKAAFDHSCTAILESRVGTRAPAVRLSHCSQSDALVFGPISAKPVGHAKNPTAGEGEGGEICVRAVFGCLSHASN
jgi:hypothetical protein